MSMAGASPVTPVHNFRQVAWQSPKACEFRESR
jgi:hypothetical protein